MVAPLIWFGIAGLLGMVGCAASSGNRREEPSAPGKGDIFKKTDKSPVIPDDPCPDYDACVCSEATGWVPGLYTSYGDNFIQIGDKRVDTGRNLVTVKWPHHSIALGLSAGIKQDRAALVLPIETFFPNIDFQFKLGTAEPADPALFRDQTALLTDKIMKVILGEYRCMRKPFVEEPIVYVSGHTDRLGSEQYNLDLSLKRALKVAEGIRYWMETNRARLIQPVTIKYVGRGEEEARQNGEADETANAKQRKVTVTVRGRLVPFQANWQELGRIYP